MENIEKQQQKSRVEEAKDVILNSAEKIEDEFRRTANTWLECFGTRVFVVETYLSGDKVEAELGEEKYNEIGGKLEILKQRHYDLKQ